MVMPKEKVIRILKRELDISKNLNGTFDDFIKECNNPNPTYTIEEVHQALSIAIKALEQEPFINKPCVSEKQCEHDKNVVLDKIRVEIEQIELLARYTRGDIKKMALDIIDKYKIYSEVEK